MDPFLPQMGADAFAPVNCMAKKFQRRRAWREAQDRFPNPYASPDYGHGTQLSGYTIRPPSLGSFTWPRDALLCAGLALLIAVAYWPVAGNDFINYDDEDYVFANEFVNQGLTVNHVVWAMTAFHEANWHPLTWLSHMLDCQVFGSNPAGHHLVNLGLHVINSMLLYWVLLRMTRAVWPSIVVAAFFAVHPLHVESVAWIAERKDVLSTMFGLTALAAWLNYLARPGLIRYLAVMLWFAASLMSKPMLVTLPFVLLFLDYWPLGRVGGRSVERGAESLAASLRPRVVEKLPLLLMSAASCVVTMIAQSRGYAVTPLAQRSLGARLATVAQAYCGYLEKMAVPVNLAPIYPLPKTVNYPAAMACGTALLVVTVLLIRAGRGRRHLTAGWFWYLGMLVPVIGIVQVGGQSMADRYSYLPLVGIFVLLAWSAAEAIERWPRLKLPMALLTAAGLLVCCLLTSGQVRLWASTESLFAHTAAVTKDNTMALTNLGLVASHKENYAEAERLYRAALQLEPANIFAMGNLASMFIKQKKYDAALEQYARIRHYRPDYPKLFAEMARAYTEQGNRAAAEECLRQAVKFQPASVSKHADLALNQQVLGKTQEALDNYWIVLRLKPGDRGASNNIAWIYATHPDSRFRNGAKAVELMQPLAAAPDCDANFLDTLAAAYAETGRFDDALKYMDIAIDRARATDKTPESIADMQRRAALYKTHQPYRDQQLLGPPDSSAPPAASGQKRK